MKKTALLSGLVLLSSLIPLDLAEAQEPLHVVKSSVNAESENAEFCLEFDHALAPLAPTRLATVLKLVSSDKPVTPQNIEASGSSLCVFPLERKKNYHLEVSGLRGASDEKMMASYSQSFIIPDRSPSLAFTAQKGDVGGFGSYKTPFVLRAVNVEHVTLEIYRITDAASMARAWQDRAQTTLAPSESAYLGRTKGQKIWQSDDISDIAPNATLEQPIT